MKYGAETHKRLTGEVLRLRGEGLSGPKIAARLGIDVGWVGYQLKKFDMSARLSVVASADNLKRARQLRAQGLPWKSVAKALGVDKWQSLARAIYVANR